MKQILCKCGCGKPVNIYRGKPRAYVHGHNNRDRLERFCEICGSQTEVIYYHRKQYLCKKHRLQMMRHNKILERTIYDKNRIIIEDDICRMMIYDVNGNKVSETIFDKQFLSKVKKYKWHINKEGYVATSLRSKVYFLHWLILGNIENLNKNLVTDHINRNPLDNRLCNLRWVTRAENFYNSDKKQDVSTRVKRNQIFPELMKQRHDELAEEMVKRRYNHSSLYVQPDISYIRG